ncbi:hypothetical protein LINPERPRIM_LOCUS40099 [Linum perenne]
MADRRKLKAVLYDSDDDDDQTRTTTDDEKDLTTELLSLGKLTLGPKKKLLIISLGGFLCHRVFKYRNNSRIRIPPNRTPDSSVGTFNGFKCLDNKFKPIFLKDLNQVFESSAVLKATKYSASNTVLIESDPYKALINPPNTAIFLGEYTADMVTDDELGARGKLRKYLDELSDADDVRSFVKRNPIGKPAISSAHPDWRFYSKIVDRHGRK